MSAAGISFGGLASGLDTQAIISALVAVEQRPIYKLEQTKSDLTKQKSLFGDLNELLDKLVDAAKDLKTTSSFLQMKATSSNEEILTASASSTATPGTYGVTVEALAKGQINSAGYSSSSDPIANASSTVSFQLDVGGSSYFISSDANLDAIANAINNENSINSTGVRAEVVDTGSSVAAERYQLVVRSEEPGEDSAFTLTYDDGGTGFQDLITDLNTDVQAATNSEIKVNGLTIYRPTNTIADLFGGITLDLQSAEPGTEVSITVSTDGEETSKKVKDVIDSYNAIVDFFETQNAIDDEGQSSSPLFGDTTIRSIRSNLRNIVGGSVPTTGNEAYQLLSQIGIESDTKGRLEFNQSKFEESLSSDETAVTSLFSDSTNGIAARLESQIDLYTDSVDGLIKTRNDGYDSRIRQTNSRIENAERRLELYEEQLRTKYANLETLLSRLQGQGSSIGNISQAFGR